MDPLLQFVILAVFAGGGAFLGSYLKRKGENLATHEDIGNVLEEVRAVTTATKEIEAQISNDVWDRQKQWELKREALFEATKRIALIIDKLGTLQAFYLSEKKSVEEGSPRRREKELEVLGEWQRAANSLDQATFLVNLVCGQALRRSLLDFVSFARKLSVEITGGDVEAFNTSLKDLLTKSNAITAAMRQELRVEKSG
ncbi:MAG TPA: hypothetical protein VNZ03_29355 [Terriglobales bacterium]|jgi:hypothetical protein|nr:hypothetical protein [Terriglobales bacterium]